MLNALIRKINTSYLASASNSGPNYKMHYRNMDKNRYSFDSKLTQLREILANVQLENMENSIISLLQTISCTIRYTFGGTLFGVLLRLLRADSWRVPSYGLIQLLPLVALLRHRRACRCCLQSNLSRLVLGKLFFA